MKKGRKIIAILSVIGILAYAGSAIYLLLSTPIETYIVSQGTIAEEEETAGYIIRNEKIVQGEDYENGIYAIALEGQKVAVGESIFRYYSDSEKEIKTQISSLNYKIQELLEQTKIETSADIKAIETQIEEKIQKLSTLTNYQEIVENKKNIDTLITKKINFIGDITENKEIKELIKQRNSYEQQLQNGSEYQKAPIGGIVSYRVDGLEEELSPNNFSLLTEEYLEDLNLKTGKIVLTSNESGKIIDNFKCYIAITMDSENAMQAEVGKNLTLRISNNEEYSAKIVQINEEKEKRTIIFEMNQMTEELINHRKVAVDVIWWNASGLKIPKQGLINENGLYYVIRNKAGVESKLLVKIVKETEKFAIIEPYSTSELQELGYSSSEIRNYKKISNYDEIVIQRRIKYVTKILQKY